MGTRCLSFSGFPSKANLCPGQSSWHTHLNILQYLYWRKKGDVFILFSYPFIITLHSDPLENLFSSTLESHWLACCMIHSKGSVNIFWITEKKSSFFFFLSWNTHLLSATGPSRPIVALNKYVSKL